MRSATSSPEREHLVARAGTPSAANAGQPPVVRSSRHVDLALLVLSVAVGLALVLLATATFIQIVRG